MSRQEGGGGGGRRGRRKQEYGIGRERRTTKYSVFSIVFHAQVRGRQGKDERKRKWIDA